jgi:hypothetical protein
MAELNDNQRKAAELMEKAAALLDDREDAVVLMRLWHAIDLLQGEEGICPEDEYPEADRDPGDQ